MIKVRRRRCTKSRDSFEMHILSRYREEAAIFSGLTVAAWTPSSTWQLRTSSVALSNFRSWHNFRVEHLQLFDVRSQLLLQPQSSSPICLNQLSTRLRPTALREPTQVSSRLALRLLFTNSRRTPQISSPRSDPFRFTLLVRYDRMCTRSQ